MNSFNFWKMHLICNILPDVRFNEFLLPCVLCHVCILFSVIHYQPHVKCHRVWRWSYIKFVKHNKVFRFMLLNCAYSLFSCFLLVCLITAVFMLKVSLQSTYDFSLWASHSNNNKVIIAIWNFRNFGTV